MEDNQNPAPVKQPSIHDIKIEISLQEYFSMSYYRHNDDKIVISEERYKLLAQQPGFNELIHVFKYEVEGRNLYRLQKLEDYKRTLIAKDIETKEQKEEREAELNFAKTKHQIIETWKKEARLRLMKTGKLTKDMIESLLIRCMNPETDRDKTFAERLNYPYREENKTQP